MASACCTCAPEKAHEFAVTLAGMEFNKAAQLIYNGKPVMISPLKIAAPE
jgi:hypothetical protein